MGRAINHGFVLSLVVMCAGAVVALLVGPAKMEMKKQGRDGGVQAASLAE